MWSNRAPVLRAEMTIWRDPSKRERPWLFPRIHDGATVTESAFFQIQDLINPIRGEERVDRKAAAKWVRDGAVVIRQLGAPQRARS